MQVEWVNEQVFFWGGLLQGVCCRALFSALAGFILLSLTMICEAASQDFNSLEGQIENTEQKLKKKPVLKEDPSQYLPPAQMDDLSISGVEDSGVRFPVRRVRLTGAHHFGRSDFAACLVPVEGHEISELQLAELSVCITKIYRSAGFSLSRAIVPPQDLEGGVLTVNVIEGVISSYQISGAEQQRYPFQRFLAPILADKPLRQKTLERQLMLINDLAGLSIKDTALEEVGELSGQFELTIYVKTWRVFSHGDLDNRGTDAVGPLQSYQSIYLNSLFGAGSSLGFSYSGVPDENEALNFGKVSIDVPLGGHGVSLSAFISGGETKPSDVRERYDTSYKTLRGEVMINWALVRERERSAWIGAGLYASTNVRSSVFGRYERDEVRGISVAGQLIFKDRFKGQNAVYANLRKGIDIWGATDETSPLRSRFDGDGEFTKFYLDFQRVQAFDEHWSFKIDGALQLATEGLLSSEEFYIGGYRFGRGFDSGLIGGDNGFGASLELRYSRDLNWGILKSLQLYGFVDAASIFDDGNIYANGIFLSSGGGGVRLSLDYGFEAEIEVAAPIEQDFLQDIDDVDVHFRLSRNFTMEDLSWSSFMKSSPLNALR